MIFTVDTIHSVMIYRVIQYYETSNPCIYQESVHLHMTSMC